MSSRTRPATPSWYIPVVMFALLVFLSDVVMTRRPFPKYGKSCGIRVSWMAEICIFCSCSSRIMSHFYVSDMKLPGPMDIIFSVLYLGFALISVGRFRPFMYVRSLAFLRHARFSGSLLELGAPLWRSGCVLVVGFLLSVSFLVVLDFVVLVRPSCFDVLDFFGSRVSRILCCRLFCGVFRWGWLLLLGLLAALGVGGNRCFTEIVSGKLIGPKERMIGIEKLKGSDTSYR